MIIDLVQCERCGRWVYGECDCEEVGDEGH